MEERTTQVFWEEICKGPAFSMDDIQKSWSFLNLINHHHRSLWISHQSLEQMLWMRPEDPLFAGVQQIDPKSLWKVLSKSSGFAGSPGSKQEKAGGERL